MHYSVVIAGAGPAGLACAKILAENEIDVLVLERKKRVGPKVCAGGITWSGLINRIPGQVEERRFLSQRIKTRFQDATIHEHEPIIATVNRVKLGQHMARRAIHAGAKIRTSCKISAIAKNSLTYLDLEQGVQGKLTFDLLVGADGSSSIVRRFLGLPVENVGVGINYQLPRHLQTMEWHLLRKQFGSGYGWIFPHSDTASIGAYGVRKFISARELKQGLISWAASCGFDLSRHEPRAELINFDFRGWKFGNIYLAGDAAGLASGLTGEGIYPAIVSGEYIANHIVDSTFEDKNFNRLIRMQKVHSRLASLTGSSGIFSGIIAETVTLGLRTRLIDFRKLEMAH